MNPIQIVLAVFVTSGVVLYLSRFRSQLADRLMVAVIAGGLITLVMMPDLSTRVANAFGVGRGADMLFYLSHAATLLMLLFLYSELRVHAAATTQLARALAIAQARPPEKRQ